MSINFNRLEEIGYSLLDKRSAQRCFHVAFLVRKNRIYTISHNKTKSHPKVKEHTYPKLAGIHAELGCFIKGNLDNYNKHKLCVLRIDRNNKLNYSRPCACCIEVCKQFNLFDVYYTNKEGKWVYENLTNVNN